MAALERLNSRLNNYFKVIKRQHHKILQNDQKLAFKDIQIHAANQMKDDIHRRCVQYHDLTNGLINLLCEMFLKTKIMTQEDADVVRSMVKLQDLKLTLSSDSLIKLLQSFAKFDFDSKIKGFIDAQDIIDVHLCRLFKINTEIRASHWLTRRVKEDPETGEQVHAFSPSKQRPSLRHGRFSAELEEKQLFNLLHEFQGTTQEIMDLKQLTGDKLKAVEQYELRDSQMFAVQRRHEQPPNQGAQSQQQEGPKNARGGRKKQQPQRKQTAARAGKGDLPANDFTVQHGDEEARRRSLFQETSEQLTSSLSKQRLLYQVDQYADREITRGTMDKLLRALRDDPVAQVLLRLRPESERSFDITSRSDGDTFGSDVADLPKDFDQLVMNLNSELSNVYILNQIERFPEKKLGKKAMDAKVKLTWLEVADCVKMEEHSSPQLNLLPLKLLML